MPESTPRLTRESIDRARLDAIVENAVTGPWGLSETTQEILREAFSQVLAIPQALGCSAFDERLRYVPGPYQLLGVAVRAPSRFRSGHRVRVLLDDGLLEVVETGSEEPTTSGPLTTGGLVAVLRSIPGFVLVDEG